MQGLAQDKSADVFSPQSPFIVLSNTVKSSKQGEFPDQFKTDSLLFGSYGKRIGRQPRAMTITCIVSGASVATLTNN